MPDSMNVKTEEGKKALRALTIKNIQRKEAEKSKTQYNKMMAVRIKVVAAMHAAE